MEAKELRLSLKKKWFEMTKAKIKPEDYRELNEYWFKRLASSDYRQYWDLEMFIKYANTHPYNCYKKFAINTMTLGYPKSGDKERTLKLEHLGIEIREGNPEWGAEPGRLYFVIKHGKILEG
ncbi:hypothetical protein J2O09_05500 [Elizabethkingia anophelis]|uniref:hypothetical protein n=1 Tax=Elizabethkingia anophelis TaxID=1117645 RepID=UPI0020B66366|nr:hypothetical protein [Elizabethkingia anophelis]UTG62411.1 hypothetical protein J2O09_05500 [Elizabethkingia anophelis]UXM68693.1 hypothetical protein N7E57_05510 [Elizabethkingia anophelis]